MKKLLAVIVFISIVIPSIVNASENMMAWENVGKDQRTWYSDFYFGRLAPEIKKSVGAVTFRTEKPGPHWGGVQKWTDLQGISLVFVVKSPNDSTLAAVSKAIGVTPSGSYLEAVIRLFVVGDRVGFEYQVREWAYSNNRWIRNTVFTAKFDSLYRVGERVPVAMTRIGDTVHFHTTKDNAIMSYQLLYHVRHISSPTVIMYASNDYSVVEAFNVELF